MMAHGADNNFSNNSRGPMFQPLKGLKVIDLSQVLAGPYATYQLALMGAEVIKIEKPGEGDWTRVLGPIPDMSARHMGLGYMTQNSDKKSVAINLKTPEGIDLMRGLIAKADIFVENFKPGVAERLGLGFDAVRETQDRIVYCSISAYGQTGPLRERPAYDHIIQGMCGIMKTTGAKGSGPTKVGAPYIDYATGMNAALGILAGLREVERLQKAVHIDVAMLDTALMMMASLATQHLSAGWHPGQNGNEAWSASPSSGAFETSDGMLMLAANNDTQFHLLCSALDRVDLSSDPLYGTAVARAENSGHLRRELEDIFLTRSAADWELILAEWKVPSARVRGLDEVLAEDHVRSRGIFSSMNIKGDRDREVFVPGLSFLANGKAQSPVKPPCELGADTKQMLTELNLDPEEFSELIKRGIIGV
ncbi:CaiB/BaiF CoA transferase family protein [Aquicoccus porphyridii]|uniref:CaiB/BaiF CoA transferase family protein n=1 Tax=Aquicoccus porphyridii TaxID=1852029 RepID=UPI00273ECFEF|nr:CaiB/BaiF CoA-transferase family protein [Aquicoccus porphyridii]